MEINKRYLSIKEKIKENPNSILIDGFDEALVGYTQNINKPSAAVYDLEKCISILIEQGQTLINATTTLENILKLYQNENDPIFISL